MATNVTLRARESAICKVPCGAALQKLAMRWSYVIRQRSRWAQSVDARQRQAERIQADLRDIGVKAADLRKLAGSGIVEVSIPFSAEARDWEARVMPWEYVLTAATASYREDSRLMVVRHLARKGTTQTRSSQKLAILEAAPGPFRKRYEFAAENGLIRSTLAQLESRTIADPTRDQLREQLRSFAPDVIHVTGIDTRLGRKLLGDDSKVTEDGLFLAGGPQGTDEVNAVDLSDILCAAKKKPQFIGFNCWDSGSRLAALTVGGGANAAIGLQHTFDDAVAEIFFVNFYRSCIENEWDYLGAFLTGWNAIATYKERIRGSSIILWSAKSLVATAEYEGFEQLESRANDVKQARKDRIKKTRDADPKIDDVAKLVQVTVTPKKQLNYSLLHNGGGVLDEFVLRFNPETDDANSESIGRVRDLHVTVELHVGTDTFPYRTKLCVGRMEERYDLANTDASFRPKIDGNPIGGIRLPLTSDLIRSVNERVQTSVFVEVSWHDQVLYQSTHPVWLAPVDEWSLTDEDICWLPSFVQPRDPDVAKIIATAQNFLKCLADYGGAGFDGYQSFDPDGRGRDQWNGIDRQVQAIWSSLVFDREIHYINPPPSYAESTQRLRTPGQTIQQGRGTCVDLAILFASCLEWIEVYPVIFMLDDHAFPGFWRSLEAYHSFFNVESENIAETIGDQHSSQEIPTPKWVSDRTTYGEIKAYVDSGDLVPLESVLLTSRSGFREAIDAGLEYFSLKRSRSFHSMVDIVSAREVVTPLPLRFSHERQ